MNNPLQIVHDNKKRKIIEKSSTIYSTSDNLSSSSSSSSNGIRNNSNIVKEKQQYIVTSMKKQKKRITSLENNKPTLTEYLSIGEKYFNSRNIHMLKNVGKEKYDEYLEQYLNVCKQSFDEQNDLQQSANTKKLDQPSTLLENVSFIERSTRYLADIENYINYSLNLLKLNLDLMNISDEKELAETIYLYMNYYFKSRNDHPKYSLEGEQIFVLESMKNWLIDRKMNRIANELELYKKYKKENLQKLKHHFKEKPIESTEVVYSKIQHKEQQMSLKQQPVFDEDVNKFKQSSSSSSSSSSTTQSVQTLPKFNVKDDFKIKYNPISIKNTNNIDHNYVFEIDNWLENINHYSENQFYTGRNEDIFSKSFDEHDLYSLLLSSRDELD